MSKIIIADDDFLIRSNLKLLLMNVEQHIPEPLELCGEAANGEEVIELLKMHKVDIVVTDVCMPKVDGLGVLKYVKRNCSDVQVIMLSGYDDYDYVRSALQNGAVDYILKHKVDEKVLQEVIQRALSVRKKHQIPGVRNENSVIALKRDFMLKLVSGFFTTEQEFAEKIHVLNLPIETRNIFPVIMKIRPNRIVNSQESYLLAYGFTNIVDEILTEIQTGICCHIADERFLILMNMESYRSTKFLAQYNTVKSRISACAQKYLESQVRFFEGRIASDIRSIKDAYTVAENQYQNRYYSKDEDTASERRDMDLLSVLDVTKEKKLLSDIRANDLGAALSVLDDIFEKLKIWKPSMKESQIVFVDLLGILNRACRERSIDISSVYPDQRPPQKVFENFCSIQEAQEWFESLFVKLINADQSASMLPDSENVLAAVRYIQKHYGEDISLSKIAEAVGLSCNYLSKQFKEQMHIGFSNYIIEYRLEKAKLFLASDNQSVKMVASRCGFQDEAYFSRVFKKYTGMTPKEYQRDQK